MTDGMVALLAVLVAGYSGGVVLVASRGLEAAAIAPAGLALGASAAVVVGVATGRVRHLTLLLVAVVGALTGALATGAELARWKAPCHVHRLVGRHAVRLTVRAVEGARAAGRLHRRQLVEAVALHRPDGSLAPACGRVSLTLAADAAPLAAGQRGRLRARLGPAVSGLNPGAGRSELYAVLRDVGARAYVRAGALVRVGLPPPVPLLGRLRRALRAGLERAVPAGPARAVIAAMVLGDRERVSSEQRDDFARAGLSHLLAISGLHMSFVAAGLLLLFDSLLRRSAWICARTDSKRWAALAAAAAAIGFTLLTGQRAATVRACVMACTLFGALALRRSPALEGPLALAALILLAGRPLLLFSPGFQLSFAAVIGIALTLRHPWARRATGLGDGPSTAGGPGVGVRIRRGAVALVLTTIGATLYTAPLVAHHFGRVSAAGLLTNVLAVPLTTFVLLPSGLIGTACAALSPAVGTVLLAPAVWSARLLGWVASETPAAAALSIAPNWLAVGASLAALTGVLTRARARRSSVVLALLLGALALTRWQESATDDRLRVAFLDVGQGDSTFVRFPDGATMLVDAGPAGRKRDLGALRVVPFLRRAGVERLDYLVVTHLHADHVGGVGAVMAAVPVAELWACPNAGSRRWRRALSRWARRAGVRARPPHPIRRGGVRVTPIWPPALGDSCGEPGLGVNDNSIVLRADFGRSSVLLAGDIEREAEQMLLGSSHPLGGALLKVPHHGSVTSSTRGWLARVRPRLAVISCAAGNRFGFPHPRVIARYRELGARVMRIDRRGAIEVWVAPDGRLSWRQTATLIP